MEPDEQNREHAGKGTHQRGINQIITRNSKYDSSPICRYWEEGVEAGDIDNCIASTENKRQEKPMLLVAFGLERVLRDRDRERVCVCVGWGGHAKTVQNPHTLPHPLSSPLLCA